MYRYILRFKGVPLAIKTADKSIFYSIIMKYIEKADYEHKYIISLCSNLQFG